MADRAASEKGHQVFVSRIEPQHSIEDLRRLLESAEPPETQPEPVQAAQEWPIVNPAPRQRSAKAPLQRQLTDAEARLVMTDGILGPGIEYQVSEVCVCVQTAASPAADRGR